MSKNRSSPMNAAAMKAIPLLCLVQRMGGLFSGKVETNKKIFCFHLAQNAQGIFPQQQEARFKYFAAD